MSHPHTSDPPTFLPFDHPDFNEDVLFEDFGLEREPFAPENPPHLDTSPQQTHDDLYEAFQELAEEEFHEELTHTPQTGEQENLAQDIPETEVPDAVNDLSALDDLLPPSEDRPDAVFQASDNTGIAQHRRDLLLGDSPPNNLSSSLIIEDLFAPSSGVLHTNASNLGDMRMEATMLTPQAALATPEMQLDHEMIDVQDVNMDMNLVSVNSARKPKVHVQEQGGGMPTTPKRSREEFDESFIPRLLPDILNSASVEGDPIDINGYSINNTRVPPPKRQRKVALPPNAFSQLGHASLKRPLVERNTNQGQASADGNERPKKRTRTRIEDMDPAMVHVCNFPGCAKKFAKKYNLKIHQRRHNGDLPFLCEYAGCAKRFMWLSSFSRHLRVHESRRNGGRRRREAQAKSEGPKRNDVCPEREPDIAISEDFSIFSIASLKVLVENELSEDVTFACALTALDSKPCENMIPVAKMAQMKRRKLLSAGRAEELYQQHALPYTVSNPHLQNFCQLLATSMEAGAMIDDSNPAL